MPVKVPFLFEDAPLAWTVDNVLDPAQCEELVATTDANRPELSSANSRFRDQDRVLREDPALAGLLFERLKPDLPAQLGGLQLSGLAQLLRLYRYRPGQRFAPHTDHWFQYDERRITLLTVLVYLNDNFVGGQTRFTGRLERSFAPMRGMAAVFQHKLEHEGCEVASGTKYVLRTDAIYESAEAFTMEVGIPGRPDSFKSPTS